jgi:hypothetical protein
MSQPDQDIGFLLEKFYGFGMFFEEDFQHFSGAVIVYFKSFTKTATSERRYQTISTFQKKLRPAVKTRGFTCIGLIGRIRAFGIEAITHRSHITLFEVAVSIFTLTSCLRINNSKQPLFHCTIATTISEGISQKQKGKISKTLPLLLTLSQSVNCRMEVEC